MKEVSRVHKEVNLMSRRRKKRFSEKRENLEAEAKEKREEKPKNSCTRCGFKIDKSMSHCPKCGLPYMF